MSKAQLWSQKEDMVHFFLLLFLYVCSAYLHTYKVADITRQEQLGVFLGHCPSLPLTL